jgi:acetylornithine deacetylase/succinyl-diaminopimelate desuccinylase-like protein
MPVAHSSTAGFIQANRARFLRELIQFVRIPSVSSQPRHAGDVRTCAEWLAEHLQRIGMERVMVEPTPRHPLVTAEWRRAPGRPTVLIYGHYDVQPADPLGEWQTPPFAPVVRRGNLYGRGASDDKGQLFAHVKALEAYLRRGGPPVNVVCLFEGEEEIGSPNLAAFLARNRRFFAADAAVVSDTRFLAPGRPAITYALRGGLALELGLAGQRQDVHSGSFGGALHNPAQALCEMIAQLHDANGHIAVPGFYDRVRLLSAEERAALARRGPSDRQILRDAQAEHSWGERGYTLYERTAIRPALTINGITSGYQGPGGKAIIPAHATAKISFRLVPDQEPREVEQLFREHIARITPPTMRSVIRTHLRAKPVLINLHHPAIRAAAAAYRQGFGVAPVFLRSGGSIPVVNTFQEILGIPTVLMGFALPDDRMHAPNEKFHLPQFYQGIATCIAFLHEVGTDHRIRVQEKSERNLRGGEVRR